MDRAVRPPAHHRPVAEQRLRPPRDRGEGELVVHRQAEHGHSVIPGIRRPVRSSAGYAGDPRFASVIPSAARDLLAGMSYSRRHRSLASLGMTVDGHAHSGLGCSAKNAQITARRVDLPAHPPHRPRRRRPARPRVPAAFDGVELDRPPLAAPPVLRPPHARPVRHPIRLVRRRPAPRRSPPPSPQNAMLRSAESTRPRRRATPPPP